MRAAMPGISLNIWDLRRNLHRVRFNRFAMRVDFARVRAHLAFARIAPSENPGQQGLRYLLV
jgi:hypothetical protein